MLPANYTFTGGDAASTPSPTPTRSRPSASRTVTATDTVTGSITGTSAGDHRQPGRRSDARRSPAPRPRSPPAPPARSPSPRKDAYGNTATGYTGTVHFTCSDGAAVLPGNYTFTGGDNGVHTFTNAYTLKTAGSRTAHRHRHRHRLDHRHQRRNHRQPGRRSDASTSPRPGLGTAGSCRERDDHRRDAFGNVATGYTGTVHFTSSDGAATLPADYTFTGGDNGVHTLSVTLKTAGSQTVTATDTVTGSITGTQRRHHRRARPAASTLVLSGTPASVTAGGSARRHGHREGRLRQHRDRLHRHRPLHLAPTARPLLPADYTFVGGDNGVHAFTTPTPQDGRLADRHRHRHRHRLDHRHQRGHHRQPGGRRDARPLGHPGLGHGRRRRRGHGHREGRLRQHRDRLHRHRPPHLHRRRGERCRATTPSSAATTASTRSQQRSETAGSQTVTATDTVTGSITGTSAGDHRQPGRRRDARPLGHPGLGHRRQHRLGHRHREGRLRQHRHRLHAAPSTFTSSDGAAVLPGNYTFIGGDAASTPSRTPTR